MLDTLQEPHIPETEKVFAFPRGFLKLENEGYSISADGSHWITIPEDHGRNIKFAWHAQKNARHTPESTKADKFVQMNCRKTAFFISGEMPIDAAINNIKDPHGTQLLMQDVDDVARKGGEAVINADQYSAIKRLLDENPSQLPALVHVFAFEEANTIQMELCSACLMKISQ